MARSIIIRQPNGVEMKVWCGADESWTDKVQELLLSNWEEYCEKHWMSTDSRGMKSESHIKSFLDRCGYMILSRDTDGIVTQLKAMKIGDYESLAADCSDEIDDALYSKAKPPVVPGIHRDRAVTIKPKKTKWVREHTEDTEARKQRIAAIRERHPNSTMIFCVVDTDNDFRYESMRYHISWEVDAYSGKLVGEDTLYDMDHIVVVNQCGKLSFYDSDFYPIAHGFIIAKDEVK